MLYLDLDDDAENNKIQIQTAELSSLYTFHTLTHLLRNLLNPHRITGIFSYIFDSS